MVATNLQKAEQVPARLAAGATKVIRVTRSVWGNTRERCISGGLATEDLRCVVVDLGNVHHMTTAAFAQLLRIKARLGNSGGRLVIRGLREQPRALCGILKLDGLLLGEDGAGEDGRRALSGAALAEDS